MNKSTYIACGIACFALVAPGIYVGFTHKTPPYRFDRTTTHSSTSTDSTTVPDHVPVRYQYTDIGIPVPSQFESDRELELLKLPWRTYENIRYHYAIDYPCTAYVQKTQEEERQKVVESASIDMGTPGITGTTSIAVAVSVKHLKVGQILQSIADQAHRTESTDVNPNLPDKRTGAMEEILFNHQTALAFTVYNTCCRNGIGDVRHIFFTHTLEGEEYYYTLKYALSGSLVEKVVESFRLTE